MPRVKKKADSFELDNAARDRVAESIRKLREDVPKEEKKEWEEKHKAQFEFIAKTGKCTKGDLCEVYKLTTYAVAPVAVRTDSNFLVGCPSGYRAKPPHMHQNVVYLCKNCKQLYHETVDPKVQPQSPVASIEWFQRF